MTRSGDENEGDLIEELVEDIVEVAPAPRAGSRSIPPPIPRGKGVRPEPTTTAVDVQLSLTAPTDLHAQATQLAAQLEATQDPTIAAMLAFEVGELFGRLGDRVRAMGMYRRAIELDPTYFVGAWAVRRLLICDRQWDDLTTLVERELAREPTPARLVEAAFVAGMRPDLRAWQERLAMVLASAPQDLNARLGLERIARLRKDPAGVTDQWLELAKLVSTVEHRVGYLLAVASARGVEAPAALAQAAVLAADHSELRVAVARASVATAAASDLDAALGVLAEVLPEGSERLTVQIRRARLARTTSAMRAWQLLPPGFPRAEKLELAATLESVELPMLAREWQSAEVPAVVAEQIALWAADAFGETPRPHLRSLLAALRRSSPGLLHLTSVAETEALASGAWTELAGIYEAAAASIERGAWLGPEAPKLEAEAAVALYIQAAYLDAVFVRDDRSIARAEQAVRRATELAPNSAAVREVAIDVAEAAGKIEDAIALVRARAPGGDRGAIERALRLATSYRRDEVALALQRELVEATPHDLLLAWRLECDLRFSPHRNEHAELLVRLVAADADPQRRGDALLPAARLAARAGDLAAAANLYRELRATEHGLDAGTAQRADREAAAIHELSLDQPGEALAIYRSWHARSPNEIAPLVGIARTAERIRDHVSAVDARAKLVVVAPASEAAWLLARSSGANGDAEGAARAYHELATAAQPIIARSATLALLERALAGHDPHALADGLERVGAQTLDVQLGVLLLSRAGWLHLIDGHQAERAAIAFAGVLARDPQAASASWGQLLAAARSGDRLRLGLAFADLASQLGSEAGASALWLRAAHIAAAERDPSLVRARGLAAVAVAPDDDAVLVTIADGAPPVTDVADPFAENEAMRVHAELLAKRSSLATGAAATDWSIEAALAFELGDQPQEACTILATILDEDPAEWRALAAVRRIARHAKHEVMLAATSFVIAGASRDRDNRLAQLRVAAAIYDRIGPAAAESFACETYRELVELDPAAPEAARYLELVRKSGDAAALVRALTAHLAWLAVAQPEAQPVELVFERARHLASLGLVTSSIADLDAILDHAPGFGPALHLRARFAAEADELDRAIAMWWRYLALDDAPERAEVEALLARHRVRAESRTEATHDGPVLEVTLSDVLATEIAVEAERQPASMPAPVLVPVPAPAPARKTAAIIRRPVVDTEPVPLVEFSDTTARIDLSTLIEQEQREVRREAEYELEITGVAVSVPVAMRSLPTERSVDAALEATVEAAVGVDVPQLPAMSATLRAPALDEPLPPSRPRTCPVLDPRALHLAPAFGLWSDDSDVVMVSYNDLQPASLAALSAEVLHEIELEVAAGNEPDRLVRLRCEAARLAALLGDSDRERAHLEAAIALEPRSHLAMRGLRRLAYREGDLGEVVTWLDAELPLASAGERDGFARYRTDVLLGLGDQDLARIAIGDRLDALPTDPEALVAQLVLAFLDDRTEELETTIQALAAAPSAILREAARSTLRVLGVIDPGEEATSVEACFEQLAAALVRGDDGAASAALFELACHVEGDDPDMAAALALRAQVREPSMAAAQLATRAASRDPLVARVAAETAQRVVGAREASQYFARWARLATGPDRAYAAAVAATGDPERFARLWATVLEVDPEDDHARRRLHALDPNAVAALDSEVDRLIETSAWSELAARLPSDAATTRALLFRARVLDRAARAMSESSDREAVATACTAALEAWRAVLDRDPLDGIAQGAALVLAHRLGPAREREIVEHIHATEPDPWAASSVGLQHAFSAGQVGDASIRELAREIGLDDPRRTLGAMLGAAWQSDLRAAATALAGRAALIDTEPEPGLEPATLRMRAAVLALESKDLAYAKELLEGCQPIARAVAALRARVAERSGGAALELDQSVATTLHAAASASVRGDHAAALRLYQRAIEHELDPVTIAMLVETARAAGAAEPLAECAKRLIAEPRTQVLGYEILAEAEQLRGDTNAARAALGLAYEHAPLRFDLALRYLGTLSASDHVTELEFRETELGRRRSAGVGAHELAAWSLDLLALALRSHAAPIILARLALTASLDNPDSALAAIIYDSVLTSSSVDAAQRASYEDGIAVRAADPRMQAAFWVRAGRTYAELGEHAEALQRFARAREAIPGYLAAVDARFALALQHQMWGELAAAATAKAELVTEPAAAAVAHQFAGEIYEHQTADVAAAISSFERALAAAPDHREAYLHLRALLEQASRHRELEALLVSRIAYEHEPTARLALQRTLAEAYYDAGQLDAATMRYREVVQLDPADPRAHAALVELATRHENGEQAASAVLARISVERTPRVLGALHHRLGEIYASDPERARRAFESALEAVPDRTATMHALADLEVATGAWPEALARGELIANLERDPEQRSRNFYRAARCVLQLRFEPKRSKQLIVAAIEAAPASDVGMRTLSELVGDDRNALAEYLDRIASAMRARVEAHPDDGVAYRTLSRALASRHDELVAPPSSAARAAAELAIIFGAGEAPEHALLARPSPLDLSRLVGLNADDHLVAGTSQPELRQIFVLLAESIARHVGPDPAFQALGRKERLVAKDPVFVLAREVAQGLGISALQVYVSSRPHGMFAEPTSPATLVVGRSVAEGDVRTVRFAAGASLKLVQLGLAVPARLDADELILVAMAMVRMVDGRAFVTPRRSDERVAAVAAALRRLVPDAVFEQVAALARTVEMFDMQQFARDLRIIGLRAGFAAAGSVLPGLALLAAASGVGLSGVAYEALGRGLVRYALA